MFFGGRRWFGVRDLSDVAEALTGSFGGNSKQMIRCGRNT